jgi:hypothetical protein
VVDRAGRLIDIEIDNVAEAKYGTKHWDEYVLFFHFILFPEMTSGFYREMSKKCGDDEITWGRKSVVTKLLMFFLLIWDLSGLKHVQRIRSLRLSESIKPSKLDEGGTQKLCMELHFRTSSIRVL